MNPYQVSTPTPIDLVELTRFNHGVECSRATYDAEQDCQETHPGRRLVGGICIACHHEAYLARRRDERRVS